jgi:hypothetical protein
VVKVLDKPHLTDKFVALVYHNEIDVGNMLPTRERPQMFVFFLSKIFFLNTNSIQMILKIIQLLKLICYQ